MNKTCLSLFLLVPAICAGNAAAQSIDQLRGYGTSDIEVPAAPSPAVTEWKSSIPNAFMVRPEARHKPDARLFSLRPASRSAGSAEEIPFLDIVRAEAAAQHMDQALILAIIQKESEFDPAAESEVGALGLMQMMPDTAVWLGLDDPSRLTDPAVSVKYGVKYMKYLWGMFNDDDPAVLAQEAASSDGFRKMVAAYNAGPGNVQDYGGVPPFTETKKYVELVTQYFGDYKALRPDK